MKKVLALLLALSMLAGCSSKPAEAEKNNAETPSAPQVSAPVEKPAETPAAPVEEEPSYPVIEAAAFDGTSLAPAEDGTLRVAYPADLYTPAPDFSPLTLWLNETIDAEQSANINIQKSEAFPETLNQELLDEMLAAQKTVEGVEGGVPVGEVEDREMPGHRMGKFWKFKRDEVDAWVKSGKAGDSGDE